ncbi:Glutathione peroxidase, house-cleaning role in reducing lipid peroxides [Xylanibacter ruminicola]|uniref:Glutathione peroxidase, house-cleaning role in reducing lipid peroxides n=1 Tax=Xylanibacter ruminicola TaxID=839 RepID=A0A1M7I658_XYLRU|nr:TlpA disulfide reductase family protein [Xylanibacter ruminicola]SFB77280.1 Glutathione peroxidase, house-cleaning role in reducing lipid peroxides [Xylanibacter ruminicola]SHM36272.1 Glutathione peroxidase, house-cleaning role in reducing lipid peroxides [Xylanibacter ruminicola]
MNKKTITTILLALVAMTGQAQIRCHVEGTLETDAWGDEVIICEAGTDLRVVDNPSFHVKAKEGRFSYDTEIDYPKLYNIFFLKQYKMGRLFMGKFIAENCKVNVTMYENKEPYIVVNGEDSCKHPILWTLYDVLNAIQVLKHSDVYVDFDKSQYERYLSLYHDTLINCFPSHPIHDQIATAEAAYLLQPGKPYIDYNVRNTDGKLVPLSTLIQGKVVLIDLWASWCGPCRQHSIAMIPIYERYKDKGFTVVAIARERNRQAMEIAAKKDDYPWQSLLELNDENQVWRKNGADNAGGAMFLIDRDGTILSTSTDAEELEPLIKKALNIELNMNK